MAAYFLYSFPHGFKLTVAETGGGISTGTGEASIMTHRDSYSWFAQKSGGRLAKRRRKQAASYHRRLRVEPLEARNLLAVLTVNTTSDVKLAGDGLVTLREAIIAANTNTATDLGHVGSGADAIVFDPSVTGTIALTFGELAITQSLTITGPGQTLLTIDGQGASKIFNFTSAIGAFNISGLTITGGLTTAVSSSAPLTIEASTLTGNTGSAVGALELAVSNCTVSDNGGWGITGTYLTLTNSTISGNSSGGLFAGRSATISNSQITNNFGVGAQAGLDISDYSYGTATVTNSTITGNSGIGLLASFSGTVTDSTLSNNGDDGFFSNANSTLLRVTANNNVGAGMAVYRGLLTLTDCFVSGNGHSGIYADEGSATMIDCTIIANRGTSGGGVYARGGSVSATNCTISNNFAGTVEANGSQPFAGSGGGIFAMGSATVVASTISGNVARREGGGVVSYLHSSTITSSTISGNRVLGTEFFSGDGGGISRTATIRYSTITDNWAEGSGGGVSGNVMSIIGTIIAGNSAGIAAPDLTAAGTVRNSLIGDNAGTTLVEAQTPDANGNLIGSSAGGGVIDPLLAPLADNGGATKTHALMAGSPALDAIPYVPVAPPPAPVHSYQLNNSLVDELGGPSLVALGGTLTATAYQFGQNQGLNLSSGDFDPADYSIEIVFTWSSLSGGWQKIIDFSDKAVDNGVYTASNGLHFLNGPFTPNLFVAGASRRLILTRDDATDVVRAYVGGTEVWNFVDAAGDAVFTGPDGIVRFFQDDNVTGQSEAGSGAIDRIRIFDYVLSAAEVSAIQNPPPPSQVPQNDQRGTPYARVVDYDGVGGLKIDMGAYESQGVPSLSQYDYNDNGLVDAADYVVWRNTKGQMDGTPYEGADGDGDGHITQLDYDLWKSHYGESLVITPPGVGSGAMAMTSIDAAEAPLNRANEPRSTERSIIHAFAPLPDQSHLSTSSVPRGPLTIATDAAHDEALLLWLGVAGGVGGDLIEPVFELPSESSAFDASDLVHLGAVFDELETELARL